MSQIMQTTALLEMSITCSIVLIGVLQITLLKEFPFVAKLIFVTLFTNVFFWPLGLSMELPLAAYVRGATGDLSIVTLLLLWSTLLPTNKANPIGFRLAIAIVAIAFYPFALGFGMIDPYAWGYGSIPFLIGVVLFATICGLVNWNKGVWIIAIAIIAWAAHWHESTNLWDYLLDPFLVIWGVSTFFGLLYRKRRDKARSGYLFRAG